MNKHELELKINEIHRKLQHFRQFPNTQGSTEKELDLVFTEYQRAKEALDTIRELLEDSDFDRMASKGLLADIYDVVIDGYLNQVNSVVKKYSNRRRRK